MGVVVAFPRPWRMWWDRLVRRLRYGPGDRRERPTLAPIRTISPAVRARPLAAGSGGAAGRPATGMNARRRGRQLADVLPPEPRDP